MQFKHDQSVLACQTGHGQGRGEFEGGLGWVGMPGMHERPEGIRLRSVSQENMDTGDTISYSDLAKSGDLDLDRKR